MDGNTDVLRVSLVDLSETVNEDVQRRTSEYTLPILCGYTQLGSGTLVQVDGWTGILTAEHVVNPPKADLRLDWTGHPERYLRTSISSFAHDLAIPTTALRIVTTENVSDAYGPDLAFIVLPPSPFLQQVKAKKSVYNLTLRTEERKKAALEDVGFFALCGFPEIRGFEAPPEHGFTETRGLYGYAMFTGPENYDERDGWDYYEMGVGQEAADDFERTFGGVSGGGVWRVAVGRDEHQPPGNEFVIGMTLAGVAFYQMDDRRFFIRSHGPVSLYRTFIERIREMLRS